jgi:predicted lactoylglutathione lyase
MNLMEPKINFITVAVADIEKSRVFYQNAFGFPVSEENDTLCLFGLKDDFYFVIQQSSELAKQTEDSRPDFPSSRFILSHNASSREEVEGIVSKVEENGGQNIKILDKVWGYSVTIKDPDSHCWEIVYLKKA